MVIGLAACGEDKQNNNSVVASATISSGSWELSSISCQGINVTYSGVTEIITLNQDTQAGESVTSDNDCTETVTFDLVPANGGLQFKNRVYTCSSPNCTIDTTIVVNGISDVTSYTCGETSPGDEDTVYSPSGLNIAQAYSSENVTCQALYTPN